MIGIQESGFKVVRVESYVPEPRQLKAHLSPVKYPMYGGAMRGGKTCWLVNSGIQLSTLYPGNRGYLCRHELEEFKRSTLKEVEKWLDPALYLFHNKSEKLFKFKNGSEMYYGGLGDDQRGLDKLKSMELGWFGVDQIEETTEDHFLMLSTRLSLNLPGIIHKGLCTANPASNWVKIRWIDQELEDHDFIPALPEDNPYNPEGYLLGMKKILPAELFKSWMRGDWDVLSEESHVFPISLVEEAMRRQSRALANVSAIGVDVAREGPDESVLAFKRANKYTFRIYRLADLMLLADKVIDEMINHREAEVKIDIIGFGAGVYDRIKRKLPWLLQRGFRGKLLAYRSSDAALDPMYKNKRAEDFFLLRNDLHALDLPLDDKLAKQMRIRYRVPTVDRQIRIESKEEFKKRIKMSPDRLDAIVIAHSRVKEKRQGRVVR